MKRILVIGCLPGINGVTTCVRNLYHYMDKTQYDWEFLIQESEFGFQHDYTILEGTGAKLHVAEYKNRLLTEKGQKKLDELLRSIPDLVGVHVHDTGGMDIYPLLAADKIGLPVKVMHIHTAGEINNRDAALNSETLQLFKDKRRVLSESHVYRLACGHDAGIYAYGDMTFSVLPNAIDLKRFSYNRTYRELIRQKLKIGSSAFVIGFPGHLWKRKNPMLAAEVFVEFHRKYPDSHMIILGEGSEKTEMYNFLNNNGLASYIHFLGYKEEMEFFYNAMDLILCTSFTEGLPYAMVEAQATGLLCLVSDNVTEEVCITNLAERISSKAEPWKWAAKISMMLENQESRRSYSSELQIAGYDIRDAANELIRIYDSQWKPCADRIS